MTLLKRKRVIGALQETVALGTPVTVGAGNAAFNAWDVECTPTLEYLERPSQGTFSRLAGVIGKRSGTMTFKTHLFGSGTPNTSPTWATQLFPACGMIETGPTTVGSWAPSSIAPVVTAATSNTQTLTMTCHQDGFRKSISGAMGTWKMTGTTGALVEIEWTFTGLWEAAIDETNLAPTYPTILPMRSAAASTITIGGVVPGTIASWSLDCGNTVVLREDVSNVTGYAHALITDRKPVFSWDPESALVASSPPDEHALFLAGTEEALALTLTDGTDTILFTAPQAQRMNVQPAERNGIQVDNIEFALNASAAAGDDEFVINF